MTLSILIPTMQKRSAMLANLMSILQPQLTDEVEVLTDIGEGTTGNKRNKLIQKATGKYIVAIDDDDEVSDNYISEILKAAQQDKDCIVFSGWMTTNGENRRDFHLSINHPYTAVTRNNKVEYLRYPNHITPIKRELVKDIGFENRTIGEDYAWATKIHDLGILKSEVRIHKFIYHYKFITNKP